MCFSYKFEQLNLFKLYEADIGFWQLNYIKLSQLVFISFAQLKKIEATVLPQFN